MDVRLILNRVELTLNPVACAKISAIQNNISIISIIGNQKTGKSTLLNKLFLNKG